MSIKAESAASKCEENDLENAYTIEIIEDHEEGGYALRIVELPGCITYANTIEEGLMVLEDAKRCWLEAYSDDHTL